MIIDRDRGCEIGLHKVRVLREGGGQSAEPHALRLEILPDGPIRSLGFLERPEARREARFADLDDGRGWDPLRLDHPIEVDVPQERGPRRDSVGSDPLQAAKSEAEHPVRLAS